MNNVVKLEHRHKPQLKPWPNFYIWVMLAGLGFAALAYVFLRMKEGEKGVLTEASDTANCIYYANGITSCHTDTSQYLLHMYEIPAGYDVHFNTVRFEAAIQQIIEANIVKQALPDTPATNQQCPNNVCRATYW